MVLLLVAAALALGAGTALFAQTPGQVTGMVAVVIDGPLYLRQGPGTNFASLDLIPAGAELPVLGERENGDWLPVSFRNRRGYVHDDFVELRPAAAQPQPAPSSAPSTVLSPQPVASPQPSPTPSAAPSTAPPASPAGSPTASATPQPATSPSPQGSPAPSASPTPSPSPSAPPLVDNGVILLGVFASDWDEMITIADEFNLVAAVVPPPGVTSVTMRVSGAPFLRNSGTFDVTPESNWLQIPNFRVDTEVEPVLREELIRKVGGTIPVRDGALVLAIDFTDAEGNARTATFQPTVFEFNRPGRVMAVEYPDLKRVTGLPPEGPGADSFFLRGDLDFHHPDDFYVRKLAIEAGRRGGVWSDNPEIVADNVFTFIDSLLGDAEPGDFNSDYNLARLIEDGTIARGRSNGGYICIGQVYFMTALTRTLGMPSRELNILVGRPNWLGNDGYWRVTWWQEGAIHVWYNGRWNHYDLWLGFKGEGGYFTANLVFQLGKAFDRRAVPFFTSYGAPVGLAGHDFGPNGQDQFDFEWPVVKAGVYVIDVPEVASETAGYLPPGAAAPRRAPPIAAPPARVDILGPPETRP